MEKYCESWSCHVPSVTCQEIPVHAHVKLYFRKLVCFLYLILLALKKQSTCDYHASFMMVPVYMVNFTNTSVCEIKFHWVKIFKLGIQLGPYLSLTRSGETLRFPLHVPLVISIVIRLCLSTSLRKISLYIFKALAIQHSFDFSWNLKECCGLSYVQVC